MWRKGMFCPKENNFLTGLFISPLAHFSPQISMGGGDLFMEIKNGLQRVS
jgi:hypothetical protein